MQFLCLVLLQSAHGSNTPVISFESQGPACSFQPYPFRLEDCLAFLKILFEGIQFAHPLFQVSQGFKPGSGLAKAFEPGATFCFTHLFFLQSRVQVPFLIRAQYLDAFEFSHQQIEFVPLIRPALVNLDGYQAIDLGAGNLLEDIGPLIDRCQQKCREIPLCQQHGPGKALKIHTGCLFDKPCNPHYP